MLAFGGHFRGPPGGPGGYLPEAGGHGISTADPYSTAGGAATAPGQGPTSDPNAYNPDYGMSPIGAATLAFGNLTEGARPNPACVIGQTAIPAANLPSGVDPMDARSIYQLVGGRVIGAVRDWQARYPWAPAPTLRTATARILGVDKVILYALRPGGWDPELLRYPVIPDNTQDAKVFSAALMLFFPDFVFAQIPVGDRITWGTRLRGSNAGSLTGSGPFPYWVKFVSSAQINAVLNYLATDQDPFGARASGQAGGITAGGAFLRAIGAGAAIGAAGGPWAAAGAAVASLVVSFFSWVFGDDPQPPGWFTRMMTTTNMRPGNFSAGLMLGSQVAGYRCHRANIQPGGEYTIIEAYAEFIRRLKAQQGSQFPWWVVFAGTAAVALVGS